MFQTPGQLHSALDNDEFRLYELIWQRTVASQMADARGTTLSLRIAGAASSGEQVVFSASGRTITFAGFLKAYVESLDEQAGGEADDAESRLPNLTQGQRVDAADLTADGHTTSPPARYTEASLIKALEELGIGRPSTYSSIIKTIQDRGYVHKKGSALVPSWVAFAVIGLLEQHFGRLVDYDFTAAMEDELDEIASGNERRTNWLNNFYFGGEHGVDGSIARAGGLKKLVGGNLEEIDARDGQLHQAVRRRRGPRDQRPRRPQRSVPRADDRRSGQPGELKPQRANLKDELTPDELTLELAEKLSPHRKRAVRSASTRSPGTRSSPRTAGTGRTSPRCCPRRPRSPRTARPRRRARSRPGPSRAPVRCCGRWTWRR